MAVEFEFDRNFLKRLIELAREEDFGASGDLTSRLLDEASFNLVGTWQLTARQAGRFCGAAILPTLIETLAPQVALTWIKPNADLSDVSPGDCVAKLNGSVGQMLAAERTLLNFLQHMSGVATMTHRFVKAAGETHAKIYDTRKTTPGLRALEKYAVTCGGGVNHRFGLFDAVLIKD
ncbi:MAG: hypothetical protein KDA33_17245, partial [Phycisphaerales bacterium]|nr:hypothetical protein [Phycisphaerales bacterium]